MVEDIKENYITGWIKTYRSFIQWEWYTAPNMAHFFMYCLLKANHKDNKWRGIEVKKGSFITSLETMKNETGLSIRNIRTCLSKLQKTGEIDKQSNKQHTIITICKYSTYQSNNKTSDKQSDKPTTNERQTSDKQATTNKNDNNIKNDNTTTNIAEVDFKKIDLWIKEISNSPTYLEGLYRLHKLKNGSVSELLITFKEHLKVFPKQHNNFSEFKKHFASWLNIKKSKRQLSKYQTQTKGQL